MKDGLYDITTKRMSAGFAIKDGKLVWCAPVLSGVPLEKLVERAVYLGPIPRIGWATTLGVVPGQPKEQHAIDR